MVYMTKPLTADFLTDRTQYVSVGGECSEDVAVTSSAPQGSVLGPTLLILMICQLFKNVTSRFLLMTLRCTLLCNLTNIQVASKWR